MLEVQAHLGREIGQAENIKSRTTRHAVVDSLTAALTAARSVKETPPNGIAIFGSPQGRWVFEPPQPIEANVYRCGSEFMLEPLEGMLESKQVYGLVVIDRKEASIGLLQGKAIKVLWNKQSQVPQKVNRGGSSQARIQRQADNAVSEWFDMVAQAASGHFLSRVDKMQGILVGGPGDTRRAWLSEAKLDYRVKAKVMEQTFDTGYTDEWQGLKELVAKAGETLVELEVEKEKKVLQRFFAGIRTGRAVYGSREVSKALEAGRVEVLLLMEDEEGVEGVKTIWVSGQTELGRQFELMGGIGALLRY